MARGWGEGSPQRNRAKQTRFPPFLPTAPFSTLAPLLAVNGVSLRASAHQPCSPRVLSFGEKARGSKRGVVGKREM